MEKRNYNIKGKMKNKKLILIGYRHPSIKLYTPKVNNKKRGLLIGLFVILILTPFTNWIFPLTLKVINKFNPLWIYK